MIIIVNYECYSLQKTRTAAQQQRVRTQPTKFHRRNAKVNSETKSESAKYTIEFKESEEKKRGEGTTINNNKRAEPPIQQTNTKETRNTPQETLGKHQKWK